VSLFEVDADGAMLENLNTSTRVKPVKETLSAIQPLLSQYDIKGYADHTLHGFDVIRSVEIIRGKPTSGYLNLGKGFGFDAALTSGYMEAIEMCTIETPPQIPLTKSFDIPDAAWIYSESDRLPFRACDRSTATSYGTLIVGIDLLTEETAYAFAGETFLNVEQSEDNSTITTNGLASGNTKSEARLHAIYEIIERHVAAQSLSSLSSVFKLELRDAPPPLSDALGETTQSGMKAKFYLLGEELDVIVILCAMSSDSTPHIHFGWGAHHSTAIAASRALAEAFQFATIRHACAQNTLPKCRMQGGILVPVENIEHFRSGSTKWEQLLHSHLQKCPTRAMDFSDTVDEPIVSPDDALSNLLIKARAEGLSHLFSWTLSPAEMPFCVVKCVIPEFGSLF
jgi:YcaO-like protein with predicted kinase domain